MEFISPLDSVFLMTESREHPMHVGGLQLFDPPEGAGPDFVRDIHDAMVANRDFQPTFRKRPALVFGGLPSVVWTLDDADDVDIGYHVRRSALPTPGRVRELLELTSRWHSGLLDRH
ncbi:MAG: wax ester/triacylglycerol synthase domain-containing protein, partial [Mycobacterium sp.]